MQYLSIFPKNDVCSIEYLNNEQYKQQLLLSNDNKNNTINQEDEDELFELYITPYTEKGQITTRNKEVFMNEDTTILKNDQKEQWKHPKMQQYQQEIVRLKKIIKKKNRSIGMLTDELKNLTDQIESFYAKSQMKQFLRIDSLQEQANSIQKQKVNQKWNINPKKQIEFLQKNNLELFQQLKRYKKLTQEFKGELQKISKILPQMESKMKRLQSQNDNLKRGNIALVKGAKECISDTKKQIKIVSKIRQILEQKLVLKDRYNQSQSLGRKFHHDNKFQRKDGQNQNGQKKAVKDKNRKNPHQKSLDKYHQKQNLRTRQRYYSHQKKTLL